VVRGTFVANPFAAGKSIRVYPRYPWPAFLYFFVPFRVISWPPFFAAGKSIRVYPRYPWPAFLYFFVPFRVISWPPFFAAGKSIRGYL